MNMRRRVLLDEASGLARDCEAGHAQYAHENSRYMLRPDFAATQNGERCG